MNSKTLAELIRDNERRTERGENDAPDFVERTESMRFLLRLTKHDEQTGRTDHVDVDDLPWAYEWTVVPGPELLH